MVNKNKLSVILNNLFYFQNNAPIWKRLHFHNELFLLKLLKMVRSWGSNFINTNASQKNIILYITSRNMRKTITPCINEENSLKQPDKMSPLNIQEILNLISYQSKKLFSLSTHTNILKFHTAPSLLGNLITRQPQGTAESRAEDEESWGGPEAFKLIVFLKDDFDDVIKKYPAVLVFFYAYWCPHCLRLKKPYGNAALMAKEAKLPMVFCAFDVTINPDMADAKGVVGIPVIKYYKNGKYATTYGGKRTAEDLLEFVKNPPPPNPSELKRPDV